MLRRHKQMTRSINESFKETTKPSTGLNQSEESEESSEEVEYLKG